MKKLASMLAVISMLSCFSSFSFDEVFSRKDGYISKEGCGCNKKKKPPTQVPPPPPSVFFA